MRSILILLIIVTAVTRTTYAQTGDLSSQVKLAVKAPQVYVEDLKPTHVSKLVTKIQTMISNYGISGVDYINDFMLYPQYEIYDHSALQTGLGKVHSIEALLTLKVIDIKTMTLFGTMSMELKGEDRGNKDKAITKSISRIKTRNETIENFLTDVKAKIIGYYQSNCNQIYTDANVLINNGQLEKAITLLQTVPRNLAGSCFEKIQALQTKAYLIYNDIICQQTIEEAEQAIKDQNPDYAKALLKLIGSSSSCYSQAKQLLDRLNNSQQSEAAVKPNVVKEKVEQRKKRLTKVVAEKTLKEEEDAFMCANYNENCN